jgi:hypothetical protein
MKGPGLPFTGGDSGRLNTTVNQGYWHLRLDDGLYPHILVDQVGFEPTVP